jgi:hypothetical protein
MLNHAPDYQITFMPHRIYRMLSAMYDVSLNCLTYYIYFKAIKELTQKGHNDWYIATHNAYYDLCIIHWCMLFGEKNREKTHFYYLADHKYNLVEHFEELDIFPLTPARLIEEVLGRDKNEKKLFSKFRDGTLLYRNKNLIHREHDPDDVYDGLITRPLVKTIFDNAFAIHRLIVKVADTFPKHSTLKNPYRLICRPFANVTALKQYYLNTFPF